MKLDFDYAAARADGYSDDDILNGLAKQGKLNFDVKAALKDGHSASEILQTIMGPASAPAAPKDPESSSLARRAGDVGISALKGVIGVPESIVGLADMVTGGAAGRAVESTGVKFRESKELLSDLYSPEQKAANQRVADAKGFTDTAGALLSNPSTLLQTGIESLPSMGAGGVVGRGVAAVGKVAPYLAGAIGEGIVGAGSAAEGTRQQTADGLLDAKQVGAALASGVGTGAFGAVGGRLAKKLGIEDIDTALVQAGAATNSKGVVRRLIEGGVSEGVFEELPQSVQEQIWQNVAMDKPLLDGVPEQAAQGLLAGGLLGGIAGGALHGKTNAPAAPADQPTAPVPLLGNTPDPLISFPDGSVGRQSDVDAFISGLPEDSRPAARARLMGLAPQEYTPADVLAAQSVDDAIAVAERAMDESSPIAQAQKNAEIDAAWQQYQSGLSGQRDAEFTAAEEARRAADVPAMQSQLADQQVAQSEALTSAQGFDTPAPTAMQVAMQEAQAKRAAMLATASQRNVQPTTGEIDGSPNAAPPAGAGQTGMDAGNPAGDAADARADRGGAAAAGAPAVTAVPGVAPAVNVATPTAGPDAPRGARRDAATDESTGAGASQPVSDIRAAPAAAETLNRAKTILSAAGVTGNERMAALRAIRTGENTLEDLIDAHPPKEMTNASTPTTASTVSGRYPAGDSPSAPIQPNPTPGRETVSERADMGSGDAGTTGLPAAGVVRDGTGTTAAADGELIDDAPRASASPTDATSFTRQLSDRYPDAKLDVAESRKTVTVSRIVIPEAQRGQGAGRRIMQDIIDHADAAGKPVALTPSADFGGSVPRLKEFYKSLGFVENKGRNKDYEISESMYRPVPGDTRASAAPAPASGMSVADINKAITRLRAKWMGFTRVNTVQSVEDLPAELRERAGVDESTEGLYDPRKKSVYLIADNISTPERAAWVAAHEIVGHGGLRMLQDKSVNEALNLAGANKFVKELANAIQQDRTDVSASIAVEEAVSELAAAIETDNLQALTDRYGVTVPATAQNGIRGVVARVLDAVRRFLASVAGNPASTVSDADVRALIGEQQAAVEGRQKVPDSAPDSAPARASSIPANQRTIEVDGERRPITDSTGKQIAGGDFTKQQAFYRWFGDSKVVDEQGRPLVVYHGTNADFSAFDSEKIGSATDDGHLGRGFYFSTDPRVIGKKTVGMPVYLRADNPLAIEMPDFKTDKRTLIPKDLSDHDAVILDYSTTGYDHKEIMVRSPEQIKSAIGNSGTFDPNEASILKSAAPAAPSPAGEERIPKWAADLSPAQQAALRKSGAIYTEQTMKQKIDALKEGALKKLQYGILDQFAPIKDKLGKVPYMMARLAKAADGTLEALMLYGRPHLDADGAMLVDTTKKGFIETMQALGGEHDRFFSWLAGRRAEQLKKEGRENLFTDDDISALATLNQGQMKDGTSREAVYLRAQKDVAELNKSVLDIAEKSGLIDSESRKVWQSDFYVPFYRVMEEGVTGPSVKSGLVNQKTIKKLKGGTNNLGDLTQNMLMNWSTLLTASAKNRAAKASLDVASDMGIAVEADEATIRAMAKSAQSKAVSYMEEGRNRWFTVEDEHVLAAISALEFNGYNNQAMKAMSWFKNTLTKLITLSPFFKVRNLIRDSISVLAVSDINRNPIVNIKNGLSLLRDDEVRAQLVAGGGLFRFGMTMEGNRAENVKRLIEDGIPEDTVLNTAEKMAKFIRKLARGYDEIGDLTENVNRAALYQQLRDQGKSHLEASFEARDLMDFGLSGAWAGVRALNQVLPFFNARLQGLRKLGVGYNDDPKRMMYVVGALALATIALSMAYKDDEDFKKRSDSDRNNYWWFKVGSVAYRIPRPFEIGAVATAIDHFMALAYDSENTNAERFTAQMGELINGQLAMNPIPQVFRPLIDVYANKDAFTGRPIESLAMQRLRPEDRYSSNTSELARLLSKSGVFVDPVGLVSGTGVKQLSPVQIDSLIKGYFAGVGVFVVAGADGLLHHTMIDRGAALPLPLRTLTGSFAEDLPTNSSRYVDMLYKTAQDVEQTYASYQNALKKGDIEGARTIAQEERTTLAKYHMIESLKKNETRIGQMIQRTMNDKLMTGEQKEETIRRLKAVQDRIARQMVQG